MQLLEQNNDMNELFHYIMCVNRNNDMNELFHDIVCVCK